MKNKIGIMGGTFNPIHNGHISIALKAYEQLELNKVLVMISPNPPHKAGDYILDINKRVDMVKLAVSSYPSILEFSDFELDKSRQGYIYTADTLTLLNKLYPQNIYYFIMGGDSLKNIESWYRPDIVLKSAVIVVAVRDDMDYNSINSRINHLTEQFNCNIKILKTDNINISSSKIRHRLNAGQSISGMVPKNVEDYLLNNNIYISKGDVKYHG